MKQKSVYLNTRWIGYFLIGMGVFFFALALFAQVISPTTNTLPLEQTILFRLIFLASFGLPALVLLIIGGIVLFRNSRKRKREEALKAHGKKIQATNLTIESSNVQVNRQYQMYLTCTYQDKKGDYFLFKSRLLRLNPLPFLGDEVTVYVDPEKQQDYFVDIEGSMAKVYE
ncbi:MULTISPECIES: DUF3592 domain-containing protein [Enterococcus]|uniref:DUF3592 domain-containing protein n=1 Tax=Enterococcus alcedinis TaxID=1274384 RepID=A0A917JHC7_9ENTE|nr:DUF3592 domain-containing protein [Enterococcus alcedinis]MBP2101730.1 hypothetical protein [Enterococcus alcedinis]GGI65294.1 hypothetical protein GCM10011482_09480 [Enterococcus alcedinis]